jgi:signal transduction histidine kinase
MDRRPSDETLLLAVAEHDMGAFRTLYERHAGWLAIRLARRCNDRDLVADAIHPVKPAATSAPGAPPEPPELQATGLGHRLPARATTVALAATALVALAIQLGLLAESADDPDLIRQAIPDLKAQLSTALDDLRALAHGIYPPLLAERGLVMALRAQAARSPVPVVLDADQVGRYPQDTESTVYFCALEALQNVAKHARASRATIRLADSGDTLEFSLSDDGTGFPAGTSHGSGLQGMSDRLAAHGGTLTVRSRPGQGTTITGRLPTSERTATAGFPAASPG